MFGSILRLVAVGEASRSLGDYAKNLATRYLVLSVAGTAFLGASVFAILAGFWALNSRGNDPILSAAIMAGILALAGLLIALIAYGITREKAEMPTVGEAIRQPVQAFQSQVPDMDEVGRQIEYAAREYGPVKVAATAAAGGLVAGMLAKRMGRI